MVCCVRSLCACAHACACAYLRRLQLLLQPRPLNPLLLEGGVELGHLREEAVVVVAQRREARVEVRVALLEQRHLEGALLHLAAQLRGHGAIRDRRQRRALGF